YIHPLIEAMKVYYAKNIEYDKYDYNNEGLQETSNFDSESESSDDENESDIFFDTQENYAQRSQELTDKLDSYLDLRQTPLTSSDSDPLL
ncbi:4599_t:CDS:2, partial [Cetraspora pellucida]